MSGAKPALLLFAGGRATRLDGANKALLRIGGLPIIERIRAELEPLVSEEVLLAQDATLATPRSQVVLDRQPHAGVLPALAQGLAATDAQLCIAVACDMPFSCRAVFETLLDIQARDDVDVVIPRIGDNLEPMHAVYRRAPVLAAVTRALASGERRMVSYFRWIRVREVSEEQLRADDPDLLAFFNVNTPADVAVAEQAARSRSGRAAT